ncbi:MAG: histidine phosphatase family protein [Acidimicrobiia bacterium]
MLHLVRHGEVLNPHGLVYADLPGFDLSDAGRTQAARAASVLADRPIRAVWSSPLLRAVRTAEAIAGSHRLAVRVDDDLVEWRLLTRWAGTPWADVPDRFPGELEAYLAHPDDLPFSPESLARLAERVAGVARRVAADTPGGDVVIVGHQDPLAAAERLLTGAGFAAFHDGKPDHAEVRSLQDGAPWRRT